MTEVFKQFYLNENLMNQQLRINSDDEKQDLMFKIEFLCHVLNIKVDDGLLDVK